ASLYLAALALAWNTKRPRSRTSAQSALASGHGDGVSDFDRTACLLRAGSDRRRRLRRSRVDFMGSPRERRGQRRGRAVYRGGAFPRFVSRSLVARQSATHRDAAKRRNFFNRAFPQGPRAGNSDAELEL